MSYEQVACQNINFSPQTASLLLVDNDCYFSQGIKTLLDFYNFQNARKFLIIGETVRENRLINLVEQQCPDLVLLDLESKQGYCRGLEIIARLKQISPHSKVLVLSTRQEDEVIFQAMQAGAWGYVCKDSLGEQLLPAVNTILEERIYLAPREATGFFRSFNQRNERSRARFQQVKLTEREREVLQLLVEGASNRKIAEQLYITIATVKAHLTSIFEKFDVDSRTQAIIKAFRLGLV